MQRRHRSFALVCAALALGGAVALACTDPEYIFLGRRYAPDRDCLGTTVAMDVLKGADPGNCEARCVSAFPQPDAAPAIFIDVGGGDGGRDVYVTVMCPPLPVDVKPVPSDHPVCVKALDALARKNTCLADGGATSPLDASAPDAAASDAASTD